MVRVTATVFTLAILSLEWDQHNLINLSNIPCYESRRDRDCHRTNYCRNLLNFLCLRPAFKFVDWTEFVRSVHTICREAVTYLSLVEK